MVATRLRAVSVLVVVLLVAVSCTRGGGSPELTITMDEYDLRVSPDRAESGRVRIFIDNEGTEEHGLVFAYAEDPESLPLQPDGTVDVDALNVADRLEPVGPGRFRIEPLLRPGPIVVFCNLVSEGPDGQPISHFQQGMWAQLEITDDGSADDTGDDGTGGQIG